MNLFTQIVCLSTILFLSACGAGGGSGSTSSVNLTGLIPTSPSASCPNGGINLQAGADSNANGVLDQPEVTSSNVICNGKNGNSVLNGTSGPTNAAGIDGDFYLNTVALVLHGPKVNGTWPITGISLMGPTGATGA